jgi:small subunit ribosomal protein S2
VVADAVADGLVARAAQAANAGRDEKPEPAAAGQLAVDEPMPEWERDLLQPSAGDVPAAAASTEASAAAPAAEAPDAPAAEAPDAPGAEAPDAPAAEAADAPATDAPTADAPAPAEAPAQPSA